MTDPTDELRGLLDARIVWLTWKAETRPSTLLADILPDELPLLKSALSQHEADKREIERKDAALRGMIYRNDEPVRAREDDRKPLMQDQRRCAHQGPTSPHPQGPPTMSDVERWREKLVRQRPTFMNDAKYGARWRNFLASDEAVERIARKLFGHNHPGSNPEADWAGDPAWTSYRDEILRRHRPAGLHRSIRGERTWVSGEASVLRGLLVMADIAGLTIHEDEDGDRYEAWTISRGVLFSQVFRCDPLTGWPLD